MFNPIITHLHQLAASVVQHSTRCAESPEPDVQMQKACYYLLSYLELNRDFFLGRTNESAPD